MKRAERIADGMALIWRPMDALFRIIIPQKGRDKAEKQEGQRLAPSGKANIQTRTLKCPFGFAGSVRCPFTEENCGGYRAPAPAGPGVWRRQPTDLGPGETPAATSALADCSRVLS